MGVSVIKEQGDMGLFCDPITESEQTSLNKVSEKKETEEKKDKK